MVKLLHKILFAAISFSFFVSATEMDLGDAHNTFFDEYDTYVKTEQVSIDHAEVQQQQQQELCEFISFLFWDGYNDLSYKTAIQKTEYISLNRTPPKLFLRNSVWRI